MLDPVIQQEATGCGIADVLAQCREISAGVKGARK